MPIATIINTTTTTKHNNVLYIMIYWYIRVCYKEIRYVQTLPS
jgi:hypothetical protein